MPDKKHIQLKSLDANN